MFIYLKGDMLLTEGGLSPGSTLLKTRHSSGHSHGWTHWILRMMSYFLVRDGNVVVIHSMVCTLHAIPRKSDSYKP